MLGVGRGAQRDGFDRFQRYHFARYFGKALDPSEYAHKAIGVDLDHVAGVVPAVNRRLQHAGLVEQVIALHHVRAAHAEQAALGNARHRFQSGFQTRQQGPNAASAERHGRIHRQHRRAFGGAVTFQNADAEFVHPGGAHAVVELLRPGHDVTQLVEIVRVGKARIVAEESAGAEQHRAAAVVNDLGDDAVMQWRRVEEHFRASHQRHDAAAGKAEGMKQRQRNHEFVGRREVDHRADLRDVGQDAAMRVHHAFGFAFGTGGEQHHGRRVRIAGRHGQAGQPARIAD